MTVSRYLTLVTLCSIVALGGDPPLGHTKSSGTVSSEEALQKLLTGNTRFVASKGEACTKSTAGRRRDLVSGQAPFALILSCSDSRVPPELIFDQSLGDIFVVRVAGNVPDPVVVGSLEYGAEHLGAPVLIVLGHSRCGAVTAAVKAQEQTSEGNLGAILREIAPAVEQARRESQGKDPGEMIDAAILKNIRLVAQHLTTTSTVLRTLVMKGKLTIVGAQYNLDSGRVIPLDTTSPQRPAQ